ncbi:MAG: RecX family transcriptional regulator [Bacteroidales bacterium]|nr:RecX family transcriptional regulator [Bacteroidales bacterium]
MTDDYPFILDKIRRFCDYQERCISEVKDKLRSWEIQSEVCDKIIKILQNENLIDEDRYVKAYALGKLRNNHWGRNKILYALRMKGIPDLTIQIGLLELDTEEYTEVLKKLLKHKKVKAADAYTEKAKLAQYAIGKGFQPQLVWELLNQND